MATLPPDGPPWRAGSVGGDFLQPLGIAPALPVGAIIHLSRRGGGTCGKRKHEGEQAKDMDDAGQVSLLLDTAAT
ncbi:hypothetical protein ATCC53582_02376 [Novacetimonas hansenii]|nr:hypothetical protein ATCC53582_02376 [Novacetimonas hansenii]